MACEELLFCVRPTCKFFGQIFVAVDKVPFDFGDYFQCVNLAGDIVLGAFWRQVGQLD
jgi:hypothetical protein